jgi:hypothetical protein
MVELEKFAEIEEDDHLLDDILIVTDFTNLQNQYRDWKVASFDDAYSIDFAIA